MRNQKGVTLTILVITILILSIVVATTANIGVDVIKSSKFERFKTELKIMQTQVNDNYDKYKNEGKNEILTLGTVADGSEKAFQEGESGITSAEGYRLWDQDVINDLGIEGVSGDFFVNMEKRSIISRKGFDYRFKTYYTLNQIEDSLYNVDHTENSGAPTFKASYEFKGNNEYKIKITDIQYSGGYISKWDVLYKKDGDENWRTSRELEFTVEDYGTYKIKLRKDNIQSAESTLNIAKGQQMILKAGQTAPKTMNATYFDGTDTATIPAGFTVSNIEGEKKVADGLVVYDLAGATISDWEANKETIRETYNQFVFVPVDGTNLKYEKHVYATPQANDTQSANYSDTGNGNWMTYYYRNWSDWTDDGVNTESVTKYSGFYIGRYEAGIPENASFYGNENGATYYKNTEKNVTTYTPVSKKNEPVWNYISQVNAKTVSEKMYNNESVKSSLIDSYAWDTATTWMQNSGINVTNSTSWGNYLNSVFDINGLYALHSYDSTNGWNIAQTYSKGTHSKTNGEYAETATGIIERNKTKNIYDFAGNMFEWTTETGHKDGTTPNTYAVHRGGHFYSSGSSNPACYRNGVDGESVYYVDFGFRVVLYLKDELDVFITPGETAPAGKNAKYTDGTNIATIPAGFTVSKINGEKTIADGLVIYDLQGAIINDWEANKDTIRETYNQFVWIPADGKNLKYQKHVYATPQVDDTGGTNDTGNGNWRTYYYRNWSDWTDDSTDTESVAKYGGFYIGRYEAGIPQDASFYGNEDEAPYVKTTANNTGKDVTTYTPVSKKNGPVWNYISQVNSKTVSKKMYNNSFVKSSLIDSYAWDTATTWMQNSGINVTDSTSWGNYYNAAFDINGLYALHIYSNNEWNIAQTYSKGAHSILSGDRTETATGVTERNKAKNIYDFAGNMFEWTTETGTRGGTVSTRAVLRGGGFGNFGSGNPACFRYGYYGESYYYVDVGFRVALYIQ